MAQLDLKDRQIPAHSTRQNFALIGAKRTDTGTLHIAGRVDEGRISGKKLAQELQEREKLVNFVNVVGLPDTCTSLHEFVEYLNDRGPSIRFSAVVLKTVERYLPELGRWTTVESAPEEEAKFRFLYELTGFEEPTAPTELHLDRSFYERRKQIESNT